MKRILMLAVLVACLPLYAATTPTLINNGKLQSNLNLGGFKGTNAATPTASADVATKGYVDAAVSPFQQNSITTNVLDTNLVWYPSGKELRLSGATPDLQLWNTSGGSDAKRFGLVSSGGQFRFEWTADDGGSQLLLGYYDTLGNFNNFGYLTLNNQTNQISDNGTMMTFNGHPVIGEESTLVVTQYVRMPWTTLTMTGSNVSTMDFSAATMFKLTLAADAFLDAPSGLPGTSLAQTVQLFVAQDGTGGRTLTLTNGSWVVAGSGTSTNAVIGLTTNANAVTALTFTTSPFSATKVYGVVAATGP